MCWQEEGQKTQEEETQSALRLCKKQVFDLFWTASTHPWNTPGTAVKENSCLTFTDDFSDLNELMLIFDPVKEK